MKLHRAPPPRPPHTISELDVLLADPEAQAIEVYVLRGSGYERTAQSPLLDATELDIAAAVRRPGGY